MARKKAPEPSGTSPQCGECGERMDNAEQRHLWPRKADGAPRPVVHCLGAHNAWQIRTVTNPHHGTRAYPECWSCRGALGCDRCAGIPADVLCKRCACWGTPEALAVHGPMENSAAMLARRGGRRAKELHEYPASFQRAWRDALTLDAPEFAAVCVQYQAALATDNEAVRAFRLRLSSSLASIGRGLP